LAVFSKQSLIHLVSNKSNKSQLVLNTIKMELTERQQDIKSAIASAFLIAQTNEEFKAKLSEEPFDSLQEFIPFETSKSEIKEVINLDNKFDYELSESELENIAGGTDGDDENNDFTWKEFVAVMEGWISFS